MIEIYNKIYNAVETGKTAYVVTVIKVFGSTPSRLGAKMFIDENENIEGTIGGGNLEQIVIKRVLKQKTETLQLWDIDLDSEAKMACGGRVTLIVEPLFSKDKLYIIGGGHCAVQLSELAAKGGFNVTVIDNRQEWANSEKHPFAKTVTDDYKNVENHIVFSENTYIVIMTHQHRYDMDVAAKLVTHEYAYLGMIGSKSKAAKTFEHLREIGIPEDLIRKIHSPIGLQINSDTPFEIAVSIMAQLIEVKNS
jgi:xanthine dehydrogenase accessory factor